MQKLKQEKKFSDSYSSIMEGKALAATIKKQQDLEDQAEHNKTVRQFEEWNLEVYGKIQGRIAEKLDSTTNTLRTAKRNSDFQKFLDVTNSKGAIFRDIIIESEYDPLEVNRNSIKARPAHAGDRGCGAQWAPGAMWGLCVPCAWVKWIGRVVSGRNLSPPSVHDATHTRA